MRELKTIPKVVSKTTNSVSKYIRTYGCVQLYLDCKCSVKQLLDACEAAQQPILNLMCVELCDSVRLHDEPRKGSRKAKIESAGVFRCEIIYCVAYDCFGLKMGFCVATLIEMLNMLIRPRMRAEHCVRKLLLHVQEAELLKLYIQIIIFAKKSKCSTNNRRKCFAFETIDINIVIVIVMRVQIKFYSLNFSILRENVRLIVVIVL